MTYIEIARKHATSGAKRFYINPEYSQAMALIRFESFSEDDVQFFKELYLQKPPSEFTYTRIQILEAFVLRCLQHDLKDFFLTALKKRERFLSMHLTAIRGYAAYATENEIIPLMKWFMELLATISGSNNVHDAQEYEKIRSRFGLPYLVENYGYDCFKEAQKQLEEQYNDMSDEHKGFYTYDENGMCDPLLSPEEANKKNVANILKRMGNREMPDEIKAFFSLDENGVPVSFLSPEEVNMNPDIVKNLNKVLEKKMKREKS